MVHSQAAKDQNAHTNLFNVLKLGGLDLDGVHRASSLTGMDGTLARSPGANGTMAGSPGKDGTLGASGTGERHMCLCRQGSERERET